MNYLQAVIVVHNFIISTGDTNCGHQEYLSNAVASEPSTALKIIIIVTTSE